VRLTGLAPATTYHYRAVSGAASSSDLTFTTAASPTPSLASPAVASVLGADSAQVRLATTVPALVTVEYGPTTSYGASVSTTVPDTLHVVTLGGLLADSLYHFRVSIAGTLCGGGTTTVPDATFRTLPSGGGPGEVSSLASGSPLLLAKNPDLSTTLEFQDVPGAAGYNVYVADLGSYWSHGGSARNACGAATVAGPAGRLRTTDPAGGASAYFLVTAFGAKGEGPAGAGVPDSESTCAP
jgi:hypothetical protein